MATYLIAGGAETGLQISLSPDLFLYDTVAQIIHPVLRYSDKTDMNDFESESSSYWDHLEITTVNIFV